MQERMESSKNENLEFSSKEQLKNFLILHNIDIKKWGEGNAKNIDHLYKEIAEHETLLSFENGIIVRSIQPLRVHVLYNDNGRTFELIEQHQFFIDNGRGRVRNNPGAIGEKIKFGEPIKQALERAITEELGLTLDPHNEVVALPILKTEPKESGSYPGIVSIQEIHPYEVFLTSEQFNPSGYVEAQDDKHTCFIWVQKNEL